MRRLFLFLFFALSLGLANPAPASDSAGETEVSALQSFNQFAFGIILADVSFGAIEIDQVDETGAVVKDENGEVVKRVVTIPFIVAVLALGAIFFTIFFGFVNFRFFGHAIDVVRGKYDNPEDDGEISHFRALTSALSATVGLGTSLGWPWPFSPAPRSGTG